MNSDLKLARSIYFTSIDGIASFPEVMTEIRDAIADPNASPTSVSRAVERDVAFASRLLRIVNSPAAGLMRPCGSLPHAVSLIGLQRIGMHAETVASLSAITRCSSIAPEITRRVAAEAAVARALAGVVKVSAEHAYTAALLSDIGVLAILATQPNWTGPDGEVPGPLEEKERLGFDHTDLGAEVVSRWNLPTPIPDIIRFSHRVEDAAAHSREVEKLVRVLHAAEYLAPAVDIEEAPVAEEWARIAAHPTIQALGLDAVDLVTMWPKLKEGLAGDSDARESGIPIAMEEDEETAPPRRRRSSNRSFYVAMFAAVAIPAAVGFELFFRR